MAKLAAVAGIALLVLASPARATDVAAPVRAGDPLYRELRLADDLGLLDGPLRGQAPISRAEAFRLMRPLAAGVSRATGMVPVAVDPARGISPSVAARLTAARDDLVPWDLFWEDGFYPVTFDLNPLERVELAGSDIRRGTIAPRYLDFGDDRPEGLSVVRDGSLFIEGEWLAVASAWRLRFDRRDVFYWPIVLTARTGWRNVRASFGTEPLAWGPEAHGGLLLSTNARPMTQFRVESDSPFRLPGVLARAGDWTLSTFLAKLDDPHRTDARSPWLSGMRVTVAPTRWLVFGATRTTMLGGSGHDFVVTPRSVANLLLGRNENRARGDDANDTDQKGAVDWSVYLWPVLRPLPLLDGGRLYGQYAGEDSPQNGPLPSAPAASYGIELVSHGVLVRAEASETIDDHNLWYWHQVYTDGYTYRGRVIGHPMGGDSRAQSYDLEVPIGTWGLVTATLERQEHGFRAAPGTLPENSPQPVPHGVQDMVTLGVEKRLGAGYLRLEGRALREWGDPDRLGPLESWGASVIWQR